MPLLAVASPWKKGDAVKRGEGIFRNLCAQCHGIKAAGGKSFPGKRSPPALNGKGHVTHHSPRTLMEHIRKGGGKKGEWMPPFGETLNARERREVLSYLYSLWPEKTWKRYEKKFKLNKKD